jgi:hypothetical protein
MSTKVITGKVRLSYANIFEPRQNDKGEAKYSCSILIPKTDKETLKKVQAAVNAAIEEGKAKLGIKGDKIPTSLKKPLRDGDDERPDDPAYAGHYFLNASSNNKPGIAKPIGKDGAGKTLFKDITDSTEVYSGCYAKVSLNMFAFDTSGNKGIAAGLNNIVKVQDGEALAGKASVNDDFADVEFEDDIYDEEEDGFLN